MAEEPRGLLCQEDISRVAGVAPRLLALRSSPEEQKSNSSGAATSSQDAS